jgi:isoquinoline 1-oxidoreductase
MIRLIVNGVEHELAVEPDRSLLSVLREELGFTGAKYGCGEGACGACTVLVEGEPVRACQLSVDEIAGRPVTTVEGLAREGRLHPLQRAFIELGAMQCGFCTAGMIVGAAGLLAKDPDPDEARIRTALEGNVCRCGTYPRLLRAIRRAAELMRDGDARSEPSARTREPTQARETTWVFETPPPSEPTRPRAPWDLTRPEERDHFEVLTEGLVVVLSPTEPDDEEESWSTTRDCWIHIGASGIVTAFTGKVNVGQDNRTALSLLVADELRVPLEAVRLVMGDTDICPFDMGTFGSRSIPDAGALLRSNAAAARELLLATAAARWNVAPTDLVASDGSIRERDGARSISYGELLQGAKRVEIVSAETPLAPAPSERAAEELTPKLTALEIVTGAKRFPSDLTRPGLLHGAVLRPPSFGATLRSVDLERTRGISGVTVLHEDQFVGVATPSASAARRAIEAIRAEWDIEPQPSEGDLVEHLRSHPVESHGWEGPFRHEVGDVDRASAEASVRLDTTYTTAYIAHVPLETRVALAEWEGERLTVWTGTQRPFGVRWELAAALGVPESQVRVIVPDTGGGYGGKHSGEVAIEAARLARATGAPVQVRWSREEEFTWGYFRPAAVIDVRSTARGDGTLTAWEFTNVNSGTAGIDCPYEIPNQRIVFLPAASPLRQGSYRALAATANHFARESHMDELANELGVDPLELRLRYLSDDRLAAVFEAAADRAGRARRTQASGTGIGIAGGVEKDARVATCVEVRVHADGRPEVLRIVTAFECGAIVDPDNLVDQIEGATVMGLGGAFFEAIHFEAGRILNPRLSEYRVPRFGDVPPIEVILLDRRDILPAGGGETPIVAVAPALANAIFAATGVRIRSMPMAPDGILG